MPFFTKKGGRAEESFPVRHLNVTFQFTESLQISLLICDVSPFSDQVSVVFFSMDNLRLRRGRTLFLILLGPIPSGAAFLLGGFSFSSHDSSCCNGRHAILRRASDVRAGSSGLGPAGFTRQCASSPRQPWWPPSSSSPGGALWGLPGSCRAWSVEHFGVSHAACAGARPCASVTMTTTGNRLPTPFPTYEDSSWTLQSQVQASRIRMPLPASFNTAPPSPWVWPGRGSAATTSVVRAYQPARPPAALEGLPGPTGHFPGSFPGVPTPVPPPAIPALPDTEMHSLTPLHFCWVFSCATPPFVKPAGNPVPPSAPGLTSVAPTVTQPDAVSTLQGFTPDVIQSWKEEFMRDMKTSWDQFVGEASPQPNVCPAVPSSNMGPDSLGQLSSSDDWEALRAQRKAGSKQADSGVHQSSRSSERSSADRHRDRVRHRRVPPDSSSPTRHLSPPAKRSRLGSHHVPCGSSSSEGHERSPWARLLWRSRSHLPCRRGPSPSSSSHHRRSRDSPAPSRWPLEAGRTRRLAGQPSLLPRWRSPASHRRSWRSSWGRQLSPPLRTRAPNRHSSLSSSRSPSPQGRRSCSLSSSCQRSQSPSRDRISRPHAADQRLLRLRVDDGDQHPRDSPIPEQSNTVDDSQLSAEKVQKLFTDLLDPPVLSHYADPRDSTLSNQLVKYDWTSSSTAPWVSNIEPLDTHGLFQNYQSFHRLSGDQDKEACAAAYHDLTNLMLSQTSEEASLINVSSSRPKPEVPYPSELAATDELKKKQDKIHLQWPPLKDNNKVNQRTLGLYQHGPQPKSGTSDQWPPPIRNPWDKEFVPKDFPTTHKILSFMPKLWDLHASSPLMLRPPQSTAVMEVPDPEITKYPSWLEAYAARSSHTSSMSATSMVGVYNSLWKITRFLRASAAKNNIQSDVTLVDDLIQRTNSMALAAHLMAHDASVMSTELFTYLHMLRCRTVLESLTVDLPQRDFTGHVSWR